MIYITILQYYYMCLQYCDVGCMITLFSDIKFRNDMGKWFWNFIEFTLEKQEEFSMKKYTSKKNSYDNRICMRIAWVDLNPFPFAPTESLFDI